MSVFGFRLVDLFGWSAVIIGLGSSWPQVLRMRRTGLTQGVSWASSILGVVTLIVWAGYGLAARDAVQVVNNVLGLVSAVVLCSLLVRHARPRLWPAAAAVGAAIALVAVVWSGAGASGVALAATAMSMTRMVPQVRLVLRSRSLFGLCPWTTALSVLTSLLWLGYGLMAKDAAVTLTSLLAAGLSAVVAARRLPPQRTLARLAAGRLGPVVARAAAPVADFLARA